MIIRKQAGDYMAIRQHDHAEVAYQLASLWKDEFFPFIDRKQEVLHAIRNHDRAWIPHDKKVIWDKDGKEPLSFMNFPLESKIEAYKEGINQVEVDNPYGAILCSLHYTSFFDKDSANKIIQDFIKHEQKRRNHLFNHLHFRHDDLSISQHLTFLQFFDDLSLYLCLNKSGVKKKDEWPWFKDGFRQTFSFAPNGFHARWMDKETVKVAPFLFEKSVSVNLPLFKIKESREVEVENLPKKVFPIKIVPK